MIAKQLIALVHVAKARLRMSDEDYRALLSRVAGVESSKQLDEDTFEAVMTEFERLGFDRGQRGSPRSREPHRTAEFASAAQLAKLRSLWQTFTGRDDEIALGRWLEKHLRVSHPRFLRAADAGKAIAIVERMVAWKHGKGDGGTTVSEGKAS